MNVNPWIDRDDKRTVDPSVHWLGALIGGVLVVVEIVIVAWALS